jgi:hypothetical protein
MRRRQAGGTRRCAAALHCATLRYAALRCATLRCAAKGLPAPRSRPPPASACLTHIPPQGPPAAENEEGIPGGTYLTSCKGCALSEDKETLSCTHCPKGCGSKVPTNKVTVASCPDGFGNSNGKLICDTPGNQDGIPEGSYSGSCGGCKLEGSALSCSHCSDGAGGHKASTFEVKAGDAACKVIGNANGVLTCEDKAAAEEEAKAADAAPAAEEKKDEL